MSILHLMHTYPYVSYLLIELIYQTQIVKKKVSTKTLVDTQPHIPNFGCHTTKNHPKTHIHYHL
jgi:hypothetical protein